MDNKPHPAYTGEDSFVFVCYAHADIDIVYPEIQRLQESGFNIWYDEGIRPGSEWSAAIAEAIERCSAFLYFITPDAVASEHCRREVNFALEQECSMLAAHLKETEVPSALRLSLSHRQAVLNYGENADRFAFKLVQALKDVQAGRPVEFRTPERTLSIGDFRLDVGTQQLSRNGQSETLEPKDMSVLMHLVEFAPEVVSSEELLSRNWPGAVVGDNALHQVIARLRRVLGDDAKNPAYIETLSRRGYRLLAPVAESLHPRHADRVRSKTTSRKTLLTACGIIVASLAAVYVWFDRNSPEVSTVAVFEADRPTRVAIVPFRDLSPSGDFAWLAGGTSQELQNNINSLPRFTVVPYRLLADTPLDQMNSKVDLVIEGTLQAKDDRATMTISLIDTGSGKQVLNERFVGSDSDPFQLQKEISLRIARYFDNATFDPTAAPTKAEAWEPYLRYMHLQTGGDPAEEEYWLERAVEIDPAWAAGWFNLTIQLTRRAASMNEERWRNKAMNAFERLFELAPENSWMYHYATGDFERVYLGNMSEAERAYRTMVLEGDGALGYAILMHGSGLNAEAERALQNIVELSEPYMVPAWDHLSSARISIGDYSGAIEAATHGSELVPEGQLGLLWNKAMAEAKSGDIASARASLEAQTEYLDSLDDDYLYRPLVENSTSILAFEVALARGDTEEGRTQAEALAEAEIYLWAGIAFLRLGQEDRASELLQQAGAPEALDRWYIYNATMFTPPELRRHPEIRKVYNKLGYTDEWRLELCRRASTLPPDTGITCEPAIYEAEKDLEPTIAILPFATPKDSQMDLDRSQDVADEISQRLIRTDRINLVASREARRFRGTTLGLADLAAKLRATHVLEGTVEQISDKTRVGYEFIDLKSGLLVASDRIEFQTNDRAALFGAYDQIVADIARSLGIQPGQPVPQDPASVDRSAYELIARANQITAYESGLGIDVLPMIERALEYDPNYARAHLAKAIALHDQGALLRGGDAIQALRDSINSAQTALEIDPTLSYAYATIGDSTARLELDFRKAQAFFEQARRAEPSIYYTPAYEIDVLMWAGQHDHAYNLAAQWVAREPVNWFAKNMAAQALTRAGRHTEASALFDEALQIAPKQVFNLVVACNHYVHFAKNYERAAEIVALAEDAGWDASTCRDDLIFHRDGNPKPLNDLVSAAMKDPVELRYITRTLFELGRYEEHMDWFLKRIEKNHALVWVPHEIEAILEDYWGNLNEWALSDPSQASARLERIKKHRSAIDNVTVKMTL